MKDARITFSRLLDYPGISLAVFQQCINDEQNKKSPERVVESLFEKALSHFGQTETGMSTTKFEVSPTISELWLRYVQYETDLRNFKKVNEIYWRGRHTLNNAYTFIEKYESIK